MKSLYWTKEYGWPNRLILSQASKILAISHAVHRACLEARLPEEKTITIHDGVDLNRFHLKQDAGSKARTDLDIPKDEFVIGFVGRLGVDWKNEPLVYRLVGELSEWIENICLVVVGGPYDGKNETFEDSKRLARELGGRAEVRFLGGCNDVASVLPAMDVYLVPSKEEPFGRVVIEGMAAGLPVVGSNNGGIPEMITDGYDGFLRSPDDLNGWGSVVKALIDNKDLRKNIGKNARKTVEDYFTLEKMIEKVANIYLDLLHKKGNCLGDDFSS
jgi:glycosyltransferase involved in cell wall biosynthesis